MCGIAGLALRSWDQTLAGDFAGAAAQFLARRGPDAFNCRRVAPELALVQTRLSIIDLAGGAQPMSDDSGAIVYNGEIYNYRDLRDPALDWRTQSDTEVLLRGMNDHGVEFLNKIDGMFAFAYYDSRRRRLTLARDAFGIKPLYYYADGGRIGFASRLQPLMLLSAKEINRQALAEYYFSRACRGANVIFSDLHEVLPGEAITFDLARFEIADKRIWAKPQTANRRRHDPAEALAALDQAMQLAVDRHLVADVPVATLLSGGVDSGLVTALAAMRRPDMPAFSIGFHDPAFDESRYAAAVCRRANIRHHVRYCDAAEFSGFLTEWPEVMDDVVADPSAVMLYIVAQFARDSGYKVVLTGDGADELFGGYNQYHRFRLARRLYPYARHFPWAVAAVRRLTGDRSRYVHFVRMAALDPHFYGAGMIFEPHLIQDFIAGDNVFPAGASDLAGALDLDLHHRLPDDMLTRTDRATMHASIEARVPFVTRYVFDVAASLGEDLLIRGTTQKYLLKKLAERYIPRDCIYRPKKGFDLPLAEWFRGAMRDTVADQLTASWQRDYLTQGAMQRVIEDHCTFRNNNADKIWAFILLEGNVRHLRSIAPHRLELRYNFEAERLERVTGGAFDIGHIASFTPQHKPAIAVPAKPFRSILILSPDPGVPGGVSVFAEMLKARLPHDRVTALWVGSQYAQQESRFEIMRRLIRIPCQAAGLARRGAVDVVHINPSIDRSMKSILRDGMILLALRAVNFRRILVYIHGWDAAAAARIRRTPGLRLLFAWLLNQAAAIMVLAPEFKAMLEEAGVRSHKIIVTRTMFDGALLQPPAAPAAPRDCLAEQDSRPSWNRAGDAVTGDSAPRRFILFMSRFESAKGVYELLDGFAAIAAEFPDTDLVMAGDGDEFQELRARATRLGLVHRIIFTGYVTGPEKSALLHDCAVFVLPTYFPEGMPIALLEGMAAGKPLLTAKAGGIAHIVTEPQNGVVLDRVTHGAIADALRRLLTDPAWCAQAGQHNAAYAWSHFEAGIVSAEIAALYDRIANS